MAHRSIVGNRLRLSLDETLAAEATWEIRRASPALMWDVSIGRSTSLTQHLKADLFYRRLPLRRYQLVGGMLTTVDGLKERTRRQNQLVTGLAAMHTATTDQRDRPVLDLHGAGPSAARPGWWGCDHVDPVYEEDMVLSTIEMEGRDLLFGGGGLVHLRAAVETASVAGPCRPVLGAMFA
ncbi:hypothetical protein [Parafrankia sp. EUN1f]|uniref:hypothetical protein n=1 Tax=Parafrankia sp. EUN1f TaxID=102897 RepID=UPI0001C47175|nr:hypothetical protein [Parafrankia sp. EUN1f]EFC79601.1 hypothetical protein FrEUN1fDRAFT_7281 [Parafrankia sp. EUN1f]